MVDWTLIWHWLRHPFQKLPIPDFALDKHNERGWAHFFDEGTLLDNQGYVEGEKEMRRKAMKVISDPCGNGLFD